MRIPAILACTAIIFGSGFAEEPGPASLCVAPLVLDPLRAGTPDLVCETESISLKIDDRPAVPWPRGSSLELDSLDRATRHRVVVLCDGKPQQTFRFRFSEHKASQLCLFINDLYRTVQLWERKQAPWCKCKS